MERMSPGACQRDWAYPRRLSSPIGGQKVAWASIEANFDLAEVEPLLALVVGHEVFLGQALVGETGVVLIDKDGFHHAGGTQDFDVLPGGGVGQAEALGQSLDILAAAAAQDIDDLPARERAEHRTEVGHAASVDAATG